MKNKTVIFTFVIIIFLGFSLAPTFAVNNDIRDEVLKINDEIVQKKQEISELNKKIEEVKKDISKKKQEARTLENQIQIISGRVYQVELDIRAVEKNIETRELEMETLELDLKDKNKRIVEQKNLLAGLLRKLYKTSNTNYLEILLLNNNFSDFFHEIALLENLSRGLGKEINGLHELQEAIEERKISIEINKQNLEAAHESLGGKKVVLREAQTAKEVLVEAAIQSAKKLAGELDEILRQRDAIDSEVFTLQTKIQEKLNTSDKFAFSGNIILSWPVLNQGIVTSFMDPDYPFRNFFEHTGIDIRTLLNDKPSNGLSVKAAAPGIVVKLVRESRYGGNIVYIAHASSITTVYMHLSQILVSVGQEVARGDLIGYSGGMPGTPGAGRFTTGPHLHFEVRKNGVPVNPLDYLINF